LEEWTIAFVGKRTIDIPLALLKIYVFSDAFLVPGLLDAICNSLVDLELEKISYNAIIYAFNTIPADKCILDFLVAEHCRLRCTLMDDDEDEKLPNKLPRDFLLRVMLFFGNKHEAIEGSVSRCRDIVEIKAHVHAPHTPLGSIRELQTVYLSPWNTLQGLKTRICSLAGCAKVKIFFEEQEVYIHRQQTLAEFGLGTKAHILVQKVTGS
jgi:hypothetical protein